MNKFVGRMLELGAELDKAVSPIEISMVINDAEILYRNHIEQLNIPVVGSSDMHEPYLKVEKEHQLVEMEELGINTSCQMFEQCVNGVIYMLKELK